MKSKAPYNSKRQILIKRLFTGLFVLAAGFANCSKGGERKPEEPTPSDFNLEANKNISMKLQWQGTPRASEFLTVNVQFTAPEGVNLPEIQFSRFKPWMTSMGHGGYDDEQKITKNPQNPREFKVDNVYFTMPGKWDIEVSILAGGKPLQFTTPVDVEP
jgi:hypothetical protein